MTGYRTGFRALGRQLMGIVIIAGLAGCSSANSGVTTGSLLAGPAKKSADPVSERAFQVGSTSARAAKCGYNFDPAKLRMSYLAFESTQSGDAAAQAKAEKTFDTTRNLVASKIADPTEFCNEDQTAKIKADLTRHLAGDFNPPVKKDEGNLADWWVSKKSDEPFNPKDALCPNKSCY